MTPSAADNDRDLRLLLRVTDVLREPGELRSHLGTILRAFVEHASGRWGGIWLLDADKSEVRLLSVAGEPPGELPQTLHVEPTTVPENVLRSLYAPEEGVLDVYPLVAHGGEHGILAVWTEAARDAVGTQPASPSAAVGLCVLSVAQRVALVRPTAEHSGRDSRADSEVRQGTLDVVAHDLRNPLGALLMSATLLSRAPASDERSRKQLDILRRSASRINDLLGDFVDLGAVENDSVTLHPGPHPLGGIVREAIERCAPAAAEKSVHFSMSAGESHVKRQVQCDRERTMQACTVLLRHGIDVTPREGTIAVAVEETGRMVSVHFTFDATSLDEDSLALLDVGYFKARKGARRRLPLEMFLARGLVLMQGGQFDVRVQAEPSFWTLSFAFPATL